LFADFRELFHTSPYEIPLWETCLLVQALLGDSRSRVGAQVAGWDYPVSREWMLLALVHDVSISVSGVTNPSQYHLRRPWRNAGRPKRQPRTISELQKALKPWADSPS
jgi:hypothetical protein